MPRVSVIVPARNAESTLGRTLACLARQHVEGGFETIVIDDGSEDATAKIAVWAPGRVRLVRQEPNGPANARNRGVAEARGEYLAFCDADCFPASGWLEAGTRALESAELVQGRVLPDPDSDIGPYDRSLWILRDAGLWETANLFVTRRAFDRVGGFEDWLEPVVGKAMGEDVWFGWRVKRTGVGSSFCADALAHHAVFPRSAREFVLERRRLRHFPEMVAKMPELRRALLYRRVFLNRRSASLDMALAGLAAAVSLRRAWPLAAAAPYLRQAYARARGHARPAPEVLAVELAADLTGLGALVRGSAAFRTPVL